MLPFFGPRLALSSTLKRYQAGATILKTLILLLVYPKIERLLEFSIFQNDLHCLGLVGFLPVSGQTFVFLYS